MDGLPTTGRPERRLSFDGGAEALSWSEAQNDARRRAGSRDPLKLLAGFVGIADALVIFLLSEVAFVLRHGLEPMPVEILSTSVLASLLTVNVLTISGAYGTHIKDRFIAQTGQAARAWTIVFVLLLIIGYLTKTVSDFSRLWAVLWYLSGLLGLAAVRLAATGAVRRWKTRGRLASTVAIVDLSGRGAEFARRLQRNVSNQIRLVGVFSADEHELERSHVGDLLDVAPLFRIDEIFVVVADLSDVIMPVDLPLLLNRLGTIPTNVRICPLLPELGQTPIRDTALVYGVPVLTVHRRPLGAWSSVAKRIEDLAVGAVALVLLSPVMAMVALAVKLDSPGPVLFRQKRQGFNNNEFIVLKFRSMTHEPAPDTTVVQAVRNDPRVTRIGRFLRRSSLDELPQIFNVLRGDMSLVGPRPHAVAHNEQYGKLIDGYLGRHRVQPGITGWAQVNGLRGETDTIDKMRKRVEFDLNYINNWSIILDFKIIVLTAISILFDRHAY